MAEVNGLLVDLRDMPREVHEIAFAKGIIPYIPADQSFPGIHASQRDSGTGCSTDLAGVDSEIRVATEG
jgi:hypothetical protein